MPSSHSKRPHDGQPGDVDLLVIGLGYVGLPLAREACAAGMQVIGLDRSQQVVDGLNAGVSHVDDLSAADLDMMRGRGFRATTEGSEISRARSVVICVPTPLGEGGGPDLSAVLGATDAVARHLSRGTLVVLESTTYPGTTDEVLRPRIEAAGFKLGADFHLAFSPERIDPGNAKFGLRNTPKIVGGATTACTERAVALYEQVVDRVVVARGTREAEMAKLLENTYRHVNIALVNEMTKFCKELDIDLWDVIALAKTKPFGFQAFYPGPGVGGHCIPIDPNYLSHRVKSQLRYPFRFVELAQEINDSMPGYLTRRAQDLLNDHAKALRGATVLLLGVTYKANISDQRESPARAVASALSSLGANVQFHDPYVEVWHVGDVELKCIDLVDDVFGKADLIILLQDHREYAELPFSTFATPVLDTRGRLRGVGGVETL
jgi:UDP-N-acetyl-D-glucosamine dehydrogenase